MKNPSRHGRKRGRKVPSGIPSGDSDCTKTYEHNSPIAAALRGIVGQPVGIFPENGEKNNNTERLVFRHIKYYQLVIPSRAESRNLTHPKL